MITGVDPDFSRFEHVVVVARIVGSPQRWCITDPGGISERDRGEISVSGILHLEEVADRVAHVGLGDLAQSISGCLRQGDRWFENVHAG